MRPKDTQAVWGLVLRTKENKGSKALKTLKGTGANEGRRQGLVLRV